MVPSTRPSSVVCPPSSDLAGRPKGAPNKHNCKPFREALRMELAAVGENRKTLRRIAKRLLGKAAQGDIAAIREIADRLDGRPGQAVEMSGAVAMSHEDALKLLK